MKKLMILCAAVAALACVSCQENSFGPGEHQTVGSDVLNVVSESHSPASKTALGPDGVSVVWSAGDKIAVFGNEGLDAAAEEYTISGEGGSSSAKFFGREVQGNTKIAVYPASVVGPEARLVSLRDCYCIDINIPSVQNGGAGNIPANASLGVAVGTKDNMSFKNVFGVLKLQVYTTDNRTVKSFQIAAAEKLCGPATLTFSAEGSSLDFGDGSGNVITVVLDEPVALSKDPSNPSEFYVFAPVGAFANGFTVSFNQGDKLYALARTKVDNSIVRSTITLMPAKSVSFTASREKLANTIIVEPGNTAYIYPLQPETGDLLGHFKTAVSYGYSTADAKGSLSIGEYYFKFTAAQAKGYHLFGMKDYNDEYLWSWAMWEVDTPADIVLSDGSVIMDRNLCAKEGIVSQGTVRADLVGTYYQWGRKDPVFNASTNNVASSETTGTIEYAIKNPKTFIVPSADGSNAGDWMWVRNNNLWGTTKTAYDPCPAGYKVSEGSASTAFWDACNFVGNAGPYNSTLKGYPFAVLADESDLFLCGGYTSYSDLKSYTNGYYWNCNSVGMSDGSARGRVFVFSSSKITGKSTLARGNGCQIRCQKIDQTSATADDWIIE